MQTPQPNLAYVRRAMMDEVGSSFMVLSIKTLTGSVKECPISLARVLLVVLQAHYQSVFLRRVCAIQLIIVS